MFLRRHLRGLSRNINDSLLLNISGFEARVKELIRKEMVEVM
jgi:hypothetical protein